MFVGAFRFDQVLEDLGKLHLGWIKDSQFTLLLVYFISCSGALLGVGIVCSVVDVVVGEDGKFERVAHGLDVCGGAYVFEKSEAFGERPGA